MEDGSLFDWLYKKSRNDISVNERIQTEYLTWLQKLTILCDAARGMKFVHSMRIIHRDIKSQNILLSGSSRVDDPKAKRRFTAKVADFGVGKPKGGGRAGEESVKLHTQAVGTGLWMAPEVASGEEYGYACDVYSFGITMAEVLVEVPPYHHVTQKQNIHLRVAMDPEFRPLLDLPDVHAANTERFGDRKSRELFEALAKQCWTHEQHERPTFITIVQELEKIIRVAEEEIAMTPRTPTTKCATTTTTTAETSTIASEENKSL